MSETPKLCPTPNCAVIFAHHGACATTAPAPSVPSGLTDERVAEIGHLLGPQMVNEGPGTRLIRELLAEVTRSRGDAALGAALRKAWDGRPIINELHITQTGGDLWVYYGDAEESDATRALAKVLRRSEAG